MKSIFAAAAVALLGSASAFAADLPARTYTKAPVMMAPAFSWTGFYLGGNIGYAWGRSATDTYLDPTSSWAGEPLAFRNEFVALSNRRYNPEGIVGGLQAGYNFQAGSWVFGIEADINGANVDKTVTYSGVNGAIIRNFTSTTELDWFATFRPRLGYAANQTLLYVTGGAAVGEIKASWQVLSSNGYAKAGSGKDTNFGWTIGGGVEQAFSSNWSLKLEYLYTDLGDVSYSSGYLPGSTFAPPGADYRETITQDLNFHTLRVGLNYKFGGPVVGQY